MLRVHDDSPTVHDQHTDAAVTPWPAEMCSDLDDYYDRQRAEEYEADVDAGWVELMTDADADGLTLASMSDRGVMLVVTRRRGRYVADVDLSDGTSVPCGVYAGEAEAWAAARDKAAELAASAEAA